MTRFGFLFGIFLPFFSFASTGDLLNAPPAFNAGEKRVVPADFQAYELSIVIDIPARKAVGYARIQFVTAEQGSPMFDLVPDAIRSVKLDGNELGAQSTPLISDPDKEDQFRVLAATVSPNTIHTMEIQYELSPKQITFNNGGIGFGWFMSDLDKREYLELFAPSNFEFDAFPMTLNLTLKGATNPHQLFTNGRLFESEGFNWKIQFPAYFTSSSFYLHLTDKNLPVAEATFHGMERDIPVVTYGNSPESNMRIALSVLAENEATFGAYAHDSLTVYGVSPFAGGMEHCGATMAGSSSLVLGHEITHSWFARGVMPANGNAGWIDEAIASWRDKHYPTGDGAFNIGRANLGGFSAYRRITPTAAYDEGMDFLSELDYVMSASGGLRAGLKEIYGSRKRTVITTPQFQSMLEKFSGLDLTPQFAKFVYAKEGTGKEPGWPKSPFVSEFHPRPLTWDERVQLR